jgi:hypothetical protein
MSVTGTTTTSSVQSTRDPPSIMSSVLAEWSVVEH